MDMGVKNLLTSRRANIRSEIEARNGGVLIANSLTALHGKPMDRFALSFVCRENISDMPLWNNQRMQPANRKFVADRESEFIFSNDDQVGYAAKDAGVIRQTILPI
ncbi:hypothetical protein FHT86_007390 [Rhizobium sp. BK313]|jgi:hypothetical protein|nr:hypothetical protein [Rhizobium sp. BK313]